MFKKIASILILLGASLTTNANYIYEANQSLFDLTSQTGTTNMASGDDQVSGAFNLDFTFTFYGEDFTSARMATNGCLHFGSSGSYCNDYTPDPLPEITYTLYPFWTDLIRDNGSKVLAKNFTDKSVFGWYNLREYNRSNTDNSFEVILWKSNDSFEYRYGGLNIINHDVLIGEQGKSDELYTYYYHDQCGKGTTNSSSCVNQTWNASTMNTTLENGGSLYGLGTGNSIDCSNPLNNSSCAGYAAAYLAQQCGLDSLHSTSCPLYWEAYDDLQCDLDPQYAPFCAGYTQEQSVAYYVEDETDYGYTEEEYDYGYEEEFYYDDYIAEEIYEEYVTFFEEEQYEELFFEVPEEFEVFVFEEEQYEEILTVIEEEYYIPLESIEVEELPILLEEEYIDFVVDIFEQDTPDPIFLEEVLFEEFERREIIIEEEQWEEEPVEYLEFETIEELEEWFEEEEEIEEEIEEEVEEIEEEAEETRVAEEEKGGITSQMLSVVASTVEVATNSVSGTTAGTSIHATGNTKASGGSVGVGTTSTAVASSVTGGQSMSNSPSISAQVVSSVVQTQQVLNSFTADSSVSNNVGAQTTTVGETTNAQNTTANETTTTTAETTATTSVASNNSVNSNTAVGNTGGDSTAEVGETTGPQNTAVAFENNMQQQQEQLEQQQEETGEYADSTQLVAYMGTVPGFDAYRQITMPQASAWYEPKDIYMTAVIPDNNQAFFGMYSDSLNGLQALKNLQPNL